MPDRDNPTLSAPVAPLAFPVFRAVWIASMISNFGGLIQSVGASWMMISLSGSPQLIALVQASTTLPIMLLSLVAGALADNFDRRRLMFVAQAFMLLVSAALAMCAWVGLLTPWLLLAFTFLIGCGTALNSPAWQASVGDMVPRATLPGAIAFNSMGFNIARSIGPAIGGLIVAAAGAAAAFAANAVSYVGLIAVLARWRPEIAPRSAPPETPWIAITAGVRYVAMSPNIRVALFRAAVFGIAASAVPALMPLIARDLVVGGPLTYGILLGAFGAGAVAGALLSGRLRKRLSTERIVRMASLGMVGAAVASGLSTTIALTLPALILAGAGWLLALSSFNVTVQMGAPRWVTARAVSLYQMAAFGGMAAGSWGFGAVAEARGVAFALIAAGAVLAAGILIGARFPLPQADALNLDPLTPWTEPETTVPVDPHGGPIVITIEYRVAAPDIAPFLAAMKERRRIRRRDGARNWTLLRDLHDPEIWIERYHVPTWLDYVRHNQRRTHADADNAEIVRALHAGPAKPVVHRMVEIGTLPVPGDRPAGAAELSEAMTDPTRSS